MKFLSDYEEYLIYAKIADTLSQDEERLCDELLRTNEQAKETYQRLQQQLPAADVNTSFSRFKDQNKWRHIYNATDRQPSIGNRAIIRKFSVAAAVVLMVATGTWLFWKSRDKNRVNAIAKFPQKSVQLTLAGGQRIDLSHSKGSIISGEVRLTNSGKALSYTTEPNTAAGINHLIVPTGKDYQITLSDCTKIWLNAATKLDFPFAFTGNTREVTIEGEAYLEVAKQPDKPFLVHLPNSIVQVLGTSFNVNSYDKGIDQVSLVEGRVRMQARNEELELKPGNAGVFKMGTGLEQTLFDARKVLAWREGLFYFKNASVEEICRVIPRWYGMETKIDNSSIETRRFTGVVDKKQPITIFQNNLKAISGIDSYLDADGMLHFK